MKVRRWPVTGVTFAVIWVFVSGPELAPVPLLRAAVVDWRSDCRSLTSSGV